MAETTKVFTGKLTFETNLDAISKQIDGIVKAVDTLPKKIGGGAKLSIVSSSDINDTVVFQKRIDELTKTVDKLTAKLKETKTAKPELAATMDNIVQAGGASVNKLTNQMDGLYLAMAKNGNAAQGVREIFFGTASSTNFFAQKLDELAQKGISFGNSQTRLQSQMQGVANTADMSARAMALSGKAFQQTVYESMGPGAAQMTQPFMQQINRVRQAVESVGKNASLGKDTTAQLRQAQIAVKGLENEYVLLKSAGIIPVGSAADVAFQKMIKQAKDSASQVQAMSARYEQTKKSVDDTKKATDAASNSTKNMSLSMKSISTAGDSQNTILGKVNISLGKLVSGFKGLVTINQQTSQQLQQLGNEMVNLEKRTTSFGSIASKVFGATFWGSALGTITGQLLPALGKEFMDLNNLIQNTNISIEKMLSGSGVNAQEAIAGFTEYIKGVVAKTPFEFADAIDSSLRMVRQGFDPQQWLTPVADVAASMNKPLEQVVGALTKMAAGAKGMAVDMFRDIGISVNNVSAVFDKASGKALSFEETIEASKLGADEFAKRYDKLNWEFSKSGELTTSTGDALKILNAYWQQSPMFSGAAEARSMSLTGVISNLKDNFSSMLLALGQPVFQNLTLAASNLLGKFNALMPTILSIATAIGQSLSSAIAVVNGLFFNLQGTIEGFLPSINQIGYVVQAIINGDWANAWQGAGVILSNSLLSIMDTLSSFGSDAMNWGYNFVVELANGIVEASGSVLQSAMTYIGDTMASFLAPGSPPEQGPLSEIDQWGVGVGDVFYDGVASAVPPAGLFSAALKAMLELQTAENKLASANKKVVKAQKDIADAEKTGYVGADLKEKLALAQDEVKLRQEEVDFRKQALEQAKKVTEADTKSVSGGGVEKKAAKSNDAIANASKKAADTVKKTWQEAYADNLSQLEEKRQMGIISEEEYLKELLRLEKGYVDSSLKDGISAGLDDHISKIKEVQTSLDSLKPPKLGKKGLLGDAFVQDPVAEIMKRFIEVPQKLSDVAEKGAQEFVANITVKTSNGLQGFGKTILTQIQAGWDRVRKFVADIPQEWIFPFSAVAGIFAAPILEPILESVTKIGPAFKWLISNFGVLAKTFLSLGKILLRWSVYGFIVYGLIVNWDEVVQVASDIFATLSATVGQLVANISEFIKVVYESESTQEIISNVLGGISNLGLLATQMFGLLKSVAKAAILGVVVPALATLSSFLNKIVEDFGGIKPFTEKAIAALLHLSKVFKIVVRNITIAFQGIFQGDTKLIYQALEAVWADIKALFAGENPASTFVETLLTSAKNAFAKLSAPIMAQIALLFSTIRTNVTQYWNGSILPVITQWGKDALSWLVYAYANIPTALTWFVNRISEFFETAWPTIYAALATWIPKVWGWVQQAALGAGVALNGLLLAFSAWAASAEGQAAIIRFGDNLGKFIVDALTLIFKSSEGATSVLGTLLASLGAAALQLAFIAANVGVRLVQGIIDGMLQKIFGNDWKQQLEKALIDNINYVISGKILLQTFNAGVNIVMALLDGFYSVLFGSDWRRKLEDSLTSGILSLINSIKSLLGISSPSTVFMAIGSDIILGLINGVKSMLGNLGGIAKTILSSITGAMGGGAGQAAPTIDPQAMITQITGILSSISPSISPYLNQLYTLIVTQFNLAETDAVTIMEKLRIDVRAVYAGLLEDLDAVLSVASSKVTTTLTTIRTNAVGITNGMVSDIAEVIYRFDWASLGRAIDDGIIKGIDENEGLVISRLMGLAEKVLNEARKDLGISSPSVKFYEIGLQSMEGLSNGLQVGGDDTLHVMRDTLEDQMQAAAEEMFGSGGRSLMDKAFHIWGTRFTKGMAALNDAGNLNIQTFTDMARAIEPRIPQRYIDRYGQMLIDGFRKISKEAKEAFALQQIEQAGVLLKASDETVTKFNEHLTKLQVTAATTLNDLVGIADADIDNEKLNQMMEALETGATYGEDVDAAIRSAWEAQDAVTGALEEQKKMQEDLLKIEQARQKIDLMNQQLELAKMIQENNLNGAEIMNGLELGASASVSDVTEAIARALEQLVAQAQNSLGISSPSTVFEKIGSQLMQGLNVGILGSIKSVSGNISNVAGVLAGAVPTGGAGLNAGMLNNLQGGMGGGNNYEFNTNIYDQMSEAVFTAKVLKVVGGNI